MKKLYEKSRLAFAIVWIVIYCLIQSAANPLSEALDIEYSAHALISVVMAAVLFIFVRGGRLMEHFGLCRGSAPARAMLWYIPLILLSSCNLWYGVTMNMPLAASACYLVSMLCVGFIEELIFRGFLFKAMAEDNVRSAVIVSSVTFGIGHIINLVNGSGMDLASNLFQIAGAIAIGFLFVTIFHRGGSLLPCIVSHSAINMLSCFADESGVGMGGRIAFNAAIIVIAAAYTLLIMKRVPKSE